MNNQNLLIYDFYELYKILNELKTEVNYKITEVSKEKIDSKLIENSINSLFITKLRLPDVENQFVIEKLPIKLTKLIEKINLEFLKNKFHLQSDIKVGRYIIDLNSREIIFKNLKIKLTEKECEIILYLSKSKNPIGINELQSKVWGYQSELETHTVETHIYRLRKKITKIFDDSNFIVSTKNGYQIS